jgi:hypothetical protein
MNALVTATSAATLATSILRLVASDLRRFHRLLALMAALELARALFVEWTLHAAVRAAGPRFAGTFGTLEVVFLDLVIVMAAVVVTTIVVQADLPDDDGAFWRTRPIAPLALALAKLTTLTIGLVVVPSVINAVRLLAYGAPLSAIGAGTAQIAVIAGTALLPAWALALATRTLARFAVAALALLVGGYLSWNALLFWSQRAPLPFVEVWSVSVGGGGGSSSFGRIPSLGLDDWQRIDSHGWWVALAITAAAAGLIVAHYLHRRRLVSVAAAAALLAAPALVPVREAPSPAPPDLASLVRGRLGVVGGLSVPPEVDNPGYTRSVTPPATVNLRVLLTLPELPADVSASVWLRHPMLRGARTVAATDGWQCCFSGGLVGVVAPSLAEPRSPDGRRTIEGTGLGVATADLQALRDRRVSLAADGELTFRRHRAIGSLPLRPGAALRGGDRVLEVLAFQPPNVVLVRYTEFARLSGSLPTWSFFVGDASRAHLVEAHTDWQLQTGEARVVLERPRSRSRGRSWVWRYHIRFMDRFPVRDRPPLGADARLYLVESHDLGEVRMPVSFDGLPAFVPLHDRGR